MPTENLDTSILDALDRAGALKTAKECMVRARDAFEESQDKGGYSRQATTGNRLEVANYWNTRATAFFALAASLPE